MVLVFKFAQYELLQLGLDNPYRLPLTGPPNQK